VINSDGSGERRLTRRAWGEYFDAPVWSPDGTQIAFLRGRSSDCHCDFDVWIMNADGSKPHVLVTPLAQDGLGDDSPSWTLGKMSGTTGHRAPRPVTLAPTRRLSDLAPVSCCLAADGTRAAVPCLATWDVATGRLQRAEPACGYPIAVAGLLTAWIEDEIGPYHDSFDRYHLFVKRAGARPRELAVAYHFGLTGAQIDNLFGDGSLLVFNTWRQKRSGVTQARLWRLEEKRKTLLRSGADALPVVAVDGDRIVTLRRDGKLTLFSGEGKRLKVLSLGRGIEGVQLDGKQLVVLRRAILEIYDLGSGRLIRRRSSQPGISGQVRLEDVDHGIAVYVAGLAIHLLRLSDGRDVALRLEDEGSEAHAQLEPAGLFYVYNQAWTTKPGRLGFVPLREVERRLKEAG
jgi:hypothetical protein